MTAPVLLREVGGQWVTLEGGKHIFIKAKGFGFKVHGENAAAGGPPQAKTVGEGLQKLNELKSKVPAAQLAAVSGEAQAKAQAANQAEPNAEKQALVGLNASIAHFFSVVGGATSAKVQAKLGQMQGIVGDLLQRIAKNGERAGLKESDFDAIEEKAIKAAERKLKDEQSGGAKTLPAVLSAWSQLVTEIDKGVNAKVAAQADQETKAAPAEEAQPQPKSKKLAPPLYATIKKMFAAGLADAEVQGIKAQAWSAAQAAKQAAISEGMAESDASMMVQELYASNLARAADTAIAAKHAEADAALSAKKPDLQSTWSAAKAASGLTPEELAPIVEDLVGAHQAAAQEHLTSGKALLEANQLAAGPAVDLGLHKLGLLQASKIESQTQEFGKIAADLQKKSPDQYAKLQQLVTDAFNASAFEDAPEGVDPNIAAAGQTIGAWQEVLEKAQPLIEKAQAEHEKKVDAAKSVKAEAKTLKNQGHALQDEIADSGAEEKYAAEYEAIHHEAAKKADAATEKAIQAGSLLDEGHGFDIGAKAYWEHHNKESQKLLDAHKAQQQQAGQTWASGAPFDPNNLFGDETFLKPSEAPAEATPSSPNQPPQIDASQFTSGGFAAPPNWHQIDAHNIGQFAVHPLLAARKAWKAAIEKLTGGGAIPAELEAQAEAAGQATKAAWLAAGKNSQHQSVAYSIGKLKKLYELLQGQGSGATPAAPAPTAEPPSAKLSATDILKEKVGEQGGSNPGGTYLGADGVKRYVKFYENPLQSENEALANHLYRAFGIVAPNSQTFEHNGKLAHATPLIEHEGTLGTKGLTKALADKVLDGFVADAFLGNWDAAGQNLDNIVVTKNGGVARIDQGGSLLFRAKAGLKPDDALGQLSEWESFTQKNPAYAKIFEKAGVSSADALGQRAIGQIDAILKVGDQAGGWQKLIDKMAPGMDAANRQKIGAMLSARAKLLEEKRDDLKAGLAGAVEQAKLAGKKLAEKHQAFTEALTAYRTQAKAGSISSAAQSALKQAAQAKLAAIPKAPDRGTEYNHVPPATPHKLLKTASQMINWVTQHFQAAVNKWTPDQLSAAHAYKDGNYKQINHWLRGLKDAHDISDSNKAHVQKLDAGMKHGAFPEDTIMWRGFGLSQEEGAKLVPGGTFEDKGFVSTSMSHDFARGWISGNSDPVKILAQVNVPKGTPGAPLRLTSAGNESEQEIVLPRGSRFAIQNMEKRADGLLFVNMTVTHAPISESVEYGGKYEI